MNLTKNPRDTNKNLQTLTMLAKLTKVTYSYVYELECLGFIVHQLSRVMQSAISICAIYFMLLCLMNMNGGGQCLFYLF